MALRRLTARCVPAAATVAGGAASFAESNENKGEVNDEVTEPFTSARFRVHRDGEELVGTAVRCMLGRCGIARARAYAVGLYMDEGTAKGVKRSEEARNWHEDWGEAARRRVLELDDSDRRLVLVMARDVQSNHMAQGECILLANFFAQDGVHESGSHGDKKRRVPQVV